MPRRRHPLCGLDALCHAPALLHRSKLCVARGFNPVECMRLILPFQRKGLCNALWNNYVGLPYGKDFPFCAICPGINPCATHRECRWHSMSPWRPIRSIRVDSWLQHIPRTGIKKDPFRGLFSFCRRSYLNHSVRWSLA